MSPLRSADWLIEHLKRPEGPVLIFSRTKIGATGRARALGRGRACIAPTPIARWSSGGTRSKGQGGRYPVATDIAARGLDIDGIHTVINFEMPDSPEAYVTA